jgi:TrmH family RNA methyltransferase
MENRFRNELISSRQNPIVKELQAIRDDKASAFIFLEGPRLVEEAQNLPIEILVWTTGAEADPIIDTLQPKAKKRYRVAYPVFELISDVKSPQGVLAIVKRPVWNWNHFLEQKPKPILVLDGIQDPGNLATMVRTAEAAGAAGLITTPGTARLFTPKALRGAMGSTLRLPILEHQPIDGITKELLGEGYRLVGTASKSEGGIPSQPYTQVDWRQALAIVLGHEGQGLSKEWSRHLALLTHIPMQAPVESLNVAAAAAVLLFESLRQRNK